MVLADVDLEVSDQPGMPGIVGQRTRSEGSPDTVDDRDGVALDRGANGTGQDGMIGFRRGVQVSGCIAQERSTLLDRDVDGGQVDEPVGVRLGGSPLVKGVG
jgi:hypothetical protein